MKKTFAVALMLFMAVCFAPGTGSAKSGNGQGSGTQDRTQDRTQEPDRLQDGSCQIVTDGAPLLAGYKRGKRLGPQNGTGPRRDGSRVGTGTCLRT